MSTVFKSILGSPALAVAALMFLSIIAYAFTARWVYRQRKKKRQARTPLDEKLLRGPGEYLRGKIEQCNERLGDKVLTDVAAATLLSAVVAMAAVLIGISTKAGLVATILGSAMVLIFSLGWRAAKLSDILEERDNYRLGYFGERAVGESLSVLARDNYDVFHDVPAQGDGKPFNLDHVVIGASGVSLVQTKAPRKRPGRLGHQEHVVIYDGEKLIWPWADSRFEIDQVEAEAAWLQRWLREQTRVEVPIKSIIAVVGWYVDRKGKGSVVVVSHRELRSAVIGSQKNSLSPEKIEAIRKALEDACRNVSE